MDILRGSEIPITKVVIIRIPQSTSHQKPKINYCETNLRWGRVENVSMHTPPRCLIKIVVIMDFYARRTTFDGKLFNGAPRQGPVHLASFCCKSGG